MSSQSKTKDRAKYYTDDASMAMWARHMSRSQMIPEGSELDKTVNGIIAETSHLSDLDLARGGVLKMGEVITTALQMADQHMQRVKEKDHKSHRALQLEALNVADCVLSARNLWQILEPLLKPLMGANGKTDQTDF